MSRPTHIVEKNGNGALRRQLVKTLQGGNAFDTFENIVAEVPAQLRFEPPHGKGRSAWQILVHMTLSLDDLSEFIANEDGSYQEKEWPEGYWPAPKPDGKKEDWDKAADDVSQARKRLELLIEDEDRDLYARFPWGDGQTLLHEALLAIEHSAYHLGELVEISQMG
jgi:hypothetical protein